MTDTHEAVGGQERRSSDLSQASIGRALDISETETRGSADVFADGDDELLVLVCTANMGNAEPTMESVAAWLPKGGLCHGVLEEEGHAMNDMFGGKGTEAIRSRVLDERCFDVVVIGMQEATFTAGGIGNTTHREKKDDGVEKSMATINSSLSTSIAPLTPMAKADQPDYDSEDEDESVAGGSRKSAKAFNKVAKGVEDTLDKVADKVEDGIEAVYDGAKAVGTEMKTIGTNVANAVLTPIVMVAGSGGGKQDEKQRRVFSDRIPPIMKPATDAAVALNPTEWALGTKELKDAIARRLGRGYRFHVRCQRGEMRLFVLVRDEIAGKVNVSDVYAENTGIGQVMANKGGMVVTMSVGDDTRLSFMTAHLEAHEGRDHYDGRCRNLEEILMGARPGLNKKLGVAVNAGIDISPKPSRGFYDATVLSHHSFVCGDLNFRVSLPGGTPGGVGTLWEGKSKDEHRRKVRQMVEDERWDALNVADELHHALRVGDCLTGFKTPECRFNPTFKVERKEGFHYKSNRTPSYTDRILWKSVYGLENHVRPLAYGPIASFSSSDHKPMRGAFAVKLNCDKVHVPSLDQPPLEGRQHRSGTVQDGTKLLHLFVTDIKCSGLPEMRPHLKRTDPYIVFVADPLDILRFDRSKMEKVFMRFGITRNKTKKDKTAGTKTKLRSGWPRTPVANNSRDPDWGEYEVHLKIKRDAELGGRNRASSRSLGAGGERLGPKGAMLYLTVMNHDGASDQLIGTVALNLPTLCGECKAGFDASVKRDQHDLSKHDSDALPFDVIDIDEPIVRYGREQGRLKCTMSPWNLDGSESNLLFSRRKTVGKRKGKKRKGMNKLRFF